MASSLNLEIAGISVEYCFDDPGLAAQVSAEMGAFLSDARPALRLDIGHGQEMEQRPYAPVHIEEGAGRLLISRHDHRLHIDLDERRGRGVMASNTYAFGTFLRALYSRLLLDHRGIILHASAVIHRGRTYACTGRTGSGKTTIAMLCPDHVLLTDELMILRLREDGTVLACGTPFIGDSLVSGENRQEPLHCLFHLVQARENRADPMSPARAVPAVLGQMMFFDRSPSATGRALDVLTAILGAARTYELHFLPDPSIWELIDRLG